MGKPTDILKQKFQQALAGVPVIVGNEAVNFSLDRFAAQNWVGTATQSWPPRKPGAKRNNGRALLIDTGRLRRSIRVVSTTQTRVVIGTDVPYARVHNQGFRGVVHVSAHTRKISGMQKFSSGKSGKFIQKKTFKGTAQVKSYTRFMNMPRRQFIGNSPYLIAKINRSVKAHLLRSIKF